MGSTARSCAPAKRDTSWCFALVQFLNSESSDGVTVSLETLRAIGFWSAVDHEAAMTYTFGRDQRRAKARRPEGGCAVHDTQ